MTLQASVLTTCGLRSLSLLSMRAGITSAAALGTLTQLVSSRATPQEAREGDRGGSGKWMKT